MTATQDQIDAIHELPLRRDVRWLDMSWLDPGIVIEETKRPMGVEGERKWGAVNLSDPELAAQVVKIHNEWLEANKGGQVGA